MKVTEVIAVITLFLIGAIFIVLSLQAQGVTPSEYDLLQNDKVERKISEVNNRINDYAKSDSELARQVAGDVEGIRSSLESTNKIVFWSFTAVISSAFGALIYLGLRYLKK